MLKQTLFKQSAILLLTVLSVFAVAACATTPTPQPVRAAEQDVESLNQVENADVRSSVGTVVTESTAVTRVDTSNTALNGLTEGEVTGLLFMREEEKLARDVYLTLEAEWGMNIFGNIAASEQSHTDAIKALLDQFGLEDPMLVDEFGVFQNEELQALFDDLVTQGRLSLADALKVGAAIEEIDILDLEAQLAQTTNPDIRVVYENLLKGSGNHLNAFVRALERQAGIDYIPQYLTSDKYNLILGG